jgi:tRNA(Ile)-lysidine synthase
MHLIERVRRTIGDFALAAPDTRVVVALSGGPDSVALAHLMRELDAAGELRLAGCAHFNHQIRTAADRDESFCVDLASRLGAPLLVGREDVRLRAKTERRSLEDAARTARHEFLARAREELGADVVALGHTRDDQAETFLLRLLRGAGARGLASMHPRHGTLIRPLLGCRRRELLAYLESKSVPFVHDESNSDVAITRNRVRHELLPMLESRFNPSVVDVLADEAAIARDEWRWIESVADEVAPGVCRRDGREWRLRLEGLRSAPHAVRRVVLRRAMTEAAAGRPVSFAHVEDVLRLALQGGAPMDGPGFRVERTPDAIVLRERSADEGAARSNFFRYPLSIPGEVTVAEARCTVSAEIEAAPAEFDPGRLPGHVAFVRLDRCRGPLAVRSRRAGDRFRPPGLGGRKKLQDYFVDRKIARDRRDGVPLVVDEADRIVWIAGLCVDAEFRVTDPSQAMLILRLKQA